MSFKICMTGAMCYTIDRNGEGDSILVHDGGMRLIVDSVKGYK